MKIKLELASIADCDRRFLGGRQEFHAKGAKEGAKEAQRDTGKSSIGSAGARAQVMEANQINILAFTVLGNFEQVDHTQEARLAG
jgi:hypothetical protein